MASELSRLIEDELRHKGYYVGEDEPEEETSDPNQALMGALRVEARVKEQQASKQLFNLKQKLSIGGGIVIVLVVIAVLVIKSRHVVKSPAPTPSQLNSGPSGSQSPMSLPSPSSVSPVAAQPPTERRPSRLIPSPRLPEAAELVDPYPPSAPLDIGDVVPPPSTPVMIQPPPSLPPSPIPPSPQPQPPPTSPPPSPATPAPADVSAPASETETAPPVQSPPAVPAAGGESQAPAEQQSQPPAQSRAAGGIGPAPSPPPGVPGVDADGNTPKQHAAETAAEKALEEEIAEEDAEEEEYEEEIAEAEEEDYGEGEGGFEEVGKRRLLRQGQQLGQHQRWQLQQGRLMRRLRFSA